MLKRFRSMLNDKPPRSPVATTSIIALAATFVLLCGVGKVARASVCTISAFRASRVEGRVIAAIGLKPLDGALVELRDERTKHLVTRARTDDDGRFRMRRLPRGTYRLRATCEGFVLMEAIIVVPKEPVTGRELTVVLGLDVNRACGGGYVVQRGLTDPSVTAPN